MDRPERAFTLGTVEAEPPTLDCAAAGHPSSDVTLISLPGSVGLQMSRAKDILCARCRVIEITPPGGGRDDRTRVMTQTELNGFVVEAVNKLVPHFTVCIRYFCPRQSGDRGSRATPTPCERSDSGGLDCPATGYQQVDTSTGHA